MALASVKRRLRGKQLSPAHYVVNPFLLQTIADEGWHELTALGDDARRKHVHWVHVKTDNPSHLQPETFTKEQFWQHMCKVYKDVYPERANLTGSILLFGMVADELHSNSLVLTERNPHKHFTAYTTLQHYWRPIAQRSVEHYNVKLHAACHDGYTSMYVYLRCPTPKKPLAELDQSPFFSPEHPQGELLRRLLAAGGRADRANAGKKRGRSCGDAAPTARFRTSDLYDFVGSTGLKTADQFQVYAHDAASNGDKRFAEYCTVTGPSLQEHLDAAWAVHEAPRRLAATGSGRIGRLREAAQGTCVCGGVWIPGAIKVLNNNKESAFQFGHDVHAALSLGAKRGVNMAILGPPGLGKSMLFDPLDEIYRVCGRPQRDSSFPFADVLDADVLVWQEFKWSSKVCAWEDLLSLLCGEKFGIRQPGAKPTQHRNRAPMFYTARKPLTMFSYDPQEMSEYNQAMSERFNIRMWSEQGALPFAERRADFPRCGCCFARFVLDCEQQYQMLVALSD